MSGKLPVTRRPWSCLRDQPHAKLSPISLTLSGFLHSHRSHWHTTTAKGSPTMGYASYAAMPSEMTPLCFTIMPLMSLQSPTHALYPLLLPWIPTPRHAFTGNIAPPSDPALPCLDSYTRSATQKAERQSPRGFHCFFGVSHAVPLCHTKHSLEAEHITACLCTSVGYQRKASLRPASPRKDALPPMASSPAWSPCHLHWHSLRVPSSHFRTLRAVHTQTG